MHSPTMTAIKWWPGDREYPPSSPKDSKAGPQNSADGGVQQTSDGGTVLG